MRKAIFVLFITCYCFHTVVAEESISVQDNSDHREYVSKTFRTTSLFHSQSIEMMPLRSFNLVVNHKFGETDIASEKAISDFLGLDLTSNIRFGFDIPITRDLYITLGRTRFSKIYDAAFKLSLIKQTEDNFFPISISWFSEIDMNTTKLENPGDDYFFADGRPFSYKTNHRLSYFHQLIMARKFNNSISAQVAPAFTYRNLVKPGEKNGSMALPLGLKIRTSLMHNLIFEYAFLFNSNQSSTIPFAIMYEMVTASHVFQVGICSSNRILQSTIYTSEHVKINESKFIIGFNLHKTFFLSKKNDPLN